MANVAAGTDTTGLTLGNGGAGGVVLTNTNTGRLKVVNNKTTNTKFTLTNSGAAFAGATADTAFNSVEAEGQHLILAGANGFAVKTLKAKTVEFSGATQLGLYGTPDSASPETYIVNGGNVSILDNSILGTYANPVGTLRFDSNHALTIGNKVDISANNVTVKAALGTGNGSITFKGTSVVNAQLGDDTYRLNTITVNNNGANGVVTFKKGNLCYKRSIC
ncbi:MAG UNVERIFIED_CONTAM: hypothetical protein LVQ98_07165 [Rickettsiaceae bacterium]|jgi:hypothetical protein